MTNQINPIYNPLDLTFESINPEKPSPSQAFKSSVDVVEQKASLEKLHQQTEALNNLLSQYENLPEEEQQIAAVKLKEVAAGLDTIAATLGRPKAPFSSSTNSLQPMQQIIELFTSSYRNFSRTSNLVESIKSANKLDVGAYLQLQMEVSKASLGVEFATQIFGQINTNITKFMNITV